MARAGSYKLLVEVLYGIALSYRELLSKISSDEMGMSFSEENIILIFR